MEIPTKYNPSKTEDKWYEYWMKNKYFKSTPDDREAYTIVIPPPNVTGVLHMGHMLNNTIQDVLIRRARMKGYNACWVPGTDHASIATEAKVVNRLKEKGISKLEIGREEFLKHAWDWTEEHGGVILEQLKKLGASCDWDRTKFTLDEDMSKSVTKVFIDLYKKGLIYRGYRMVNWDPEAKTTVSDEEVIHIEKNGKLFYLKYQIENSEEFVIIATTRPETIFGDSAICINPNDERFTHLKGKRVIVPIANRSIPIIEDDYVDIEFGTGCLKITPAHDTNDKVIGDKHSLEVIDIFNDDATLNSNGLHYEGKDRFVCRKEIVKELDEIGCLEKTEDYKNKVGTSERTGAVIEPKVSVQWFLKMEELAKPALDSVMNDEVKLVPKKFKNTYRNWMENVRDWNISRQLWWGHRIPAFFYGKGVEDFVIAENLEKALPLAKEKTGNKNLDIRDLKQDEDALDTWFSSWLWPISVFDGINNPENEEIKYYYPTRDLVTGPDILFFWVARMIVAGYEWRDEKPFKNVYFTGIVRDKQGRKMSKSLGNSPDPVGLMEEYGADSVRAGLLLTAPAGNDLPFDTDLCMQGRNFSNKIWNAFRLVNGWEISENLEQPKSSAQAIEWFDAKFEKVLESLEKSFEQYRLSEALMTTYKFIYDDFSSWYLEMIKPEYKKPIDKITIDKTVLNFERILKILHPFMPFITEEIWQLIGTRNEKQSIMISKWPVIEKTNPSLIGEFEHASQVISGVRTIRKEKNIAQKEQLQLFVLGKENINKDFDVLISKISNLSSLEYISEKIDGAIAYRVKSNEYFVPFGETINVEEEIEKLKKELKYQQGFLISVEKKLGDKRFVDNAPKQVVEMENKKKSDALAKIKMIEESLDSLI